jgi:adenylate kinase
MVCFLLCGVPGTGKSSIAKELSGSGFAAIDLSKLVKERKFYFEYDERDGAFVADLKALGIECLQIAKSMKGKKLIFDGHLGVEVKLPVSKVCVCRCNPKELEKRLLERGYGKEKIKQNVSAEMLDYQTALAVKEYGARKVFEIDTSEKSILESVKEAGAIFEGKGKAVVKFKPRIDWSEILFEEEVRFR